MNIRTFTKRLNATELGKGNTNDTYVAIPNEVDLSTMFQDKVAITIYDCVTNQTFCPSNSNIMYTQTGQNRQERISGLGEYYRLVQANVGDEIIFERIEENGVEKYSLDLRHRNVIVLQKGNPYAEIIRKGSLQQYSVDDNFVMYVKYKGERKKLSILFKERKKKKQKSPEATEYFDLVIDGKSILDIFSYQDYIEIDFDKMQLGKMITYEDHSFKWEE